MERGVITSPMSFKFNMTGFSVSSAMSSEMIRYYLLYWDKLIVPDNNLVSYGLPDEHDLLGTGKVLRPRSVLHGSFQGAEIGQAIISEQCKWADFFKKDPTTDWVVHQHGAKQIYLNEESSDYKNTLRFRLSNALPVPSKDVNINEVLEFKEYRRPELLALHECLDELYLEVLRSPDTDLSGKQAVAKLTESINNLDRVSKERFRFFNKFDIEPQYSLSFKDVINYSAGAGLIGAGATSIPTLTAGQSIDLFSGYTIPIATLVGAAVGFMSGFSVSVKPTKALKTNKEQKHLSYLVNASKLGLVTL
ncbi:DUF6236 family protein [Vibrio parahaemolyticus]|uniref:DUF6236 family protein n=1 Tax=Vibrio parahaemolyticus TaxID=670 RepID=UPI002B20AD21|nr:DUF6236 family protein [Vibrio parahaemolyticus]MEA5181929.1 DUF6236 family protein [Vibrio parahaemolyticus]HAV1351160.1 hypothetical protein [Vibrio parahaemolyticus]